MVLYAKRVANTKGSTEEQATPPTSDAISGVLLMMCCRIMCVYVCVQYVYRIVYELCVRVCKIKNECARGTLI